MNLPITVIGTGYLGATHAVCMAELRHDVLGVDSDPAKIDRLAAAEATFYEAGLQQLLVDNVDSGRLRFTTSAASAAAFGDLHFLCVGTPQSADGLAADTSQLFTAVEALVPQLTRSTLLVGKSTVPVGTAQALAHRARELAPPGVEVEVAWNPEFLREGRAVQDTLRPDRLVVGVESAEAEKLLREVYSAQLDEGVPMVVTDIATAELVKGSANAFLATKVSFINAIAELCEAAGADVAAVTESLGLDERIGPHFLRAGLGFGGGCLPKDLRAMTARADELGVSEVATLLTQVDTINERRRTRVVELAGEECGGSVLDRRIGVLGAAFKPETDDVRDSPALDVAARLQLQGAQVTVYDPQAEASAAATFPTLRYVDEAAAAVQDADLVLHLTEWSEFAELDPVALKRVVRAPRILDGRNHLDAEHWRAAGWSYRALGRPRA